MNAGMQAARGEGFSPGSDEGIEELLLSTAAGSESALAALYDATHRKVYGLSLRILGDRALADEAVVDVFTQVWRNASRFDASRGKGLTWLLTMARSRAIDLKRHRASRTRVEVDLKLAAPRPGPRSPRWPTPVPAGSAARWRACPPPRGRRSKPLSTTDLRTRRSPRPWASRSAP